MYRYDEFDAAFVTARVGQFRDQVSRRLAGELTEDQFRPHRLMNGLYLQLHSYMLRIAVPYGTLNSRQMRKLAEIDGRAGPGFGAPKRRLLLRAAVQPGSLSALLRKHIRRSPGMTPFPVESDHRPHTHRAREKPRCIADAGEIGSLKSPTCPEKHLRKRDPAG